MFNSNSFNLSTNISEYLIKPPSLTRFPHYQSNQQKSDHNRLSKITLSVKITWSLRTLSFPKTYFYYFTILQRNANVRFSTTLQPFHVNFLALSFVLKSRVASI